MAAPSLMEKGTCAGFIDLFMRLGQIDNVVVSQKQNTFQ